MNKKEIAILFNRADEYARAGRGSEFGTSRRDSFMRKHQAITQVIADLGLTPLYTTHMIEIAKDERRELQQNTVCKDIQ